MPENPSLFGLSKSNRDFASPDCWGKNQFNNSFPVSLACYMSSKSISPVYLLLDQKLKVQHNEIDPVEIFGLDPLDEEIFYSFETCFMPFQRLIEGKLPRIDLVTTRLQKGEYSFLRGVEIKLTALPDNSTALSQPDNFGCEIVVRPDTIVYLALSLASIFENKREQLKEHMGPIEKLNLDWLVNEAVAGNIELFCDVLDKIMIENNEEQKPLMLQPIWKTKGKSLILEENCLDVFVWSDFSFTRLFVDHCRSHSNHSLTRGERTLVWLVKMLLDFSEKGKINHRQVIDNLTYDTKNDKAFAAGGIITRKYLKSPEMLTPRITKQEIKNIILGGGEKLLSPERRFDASVLTTPGLFD